MSQVNSFYGYPSSHTTIIATVPLATEQTTIVVSGSNYYYSKGIFYEKSADKYVVVSAAPVGAKVTVIPPEALVITVKSRKYYYYQGVYYVRGNNDYKVVAAPSLAVVPYIPSGHKVVHVNAQKYHVYGGVHYQPVLRGGVTAYRVTRF